jgi:hypothetical protein
MNGSFRWDFFIAHASADKAVAEELYEMLVPKSRVFLDSRCLQLGDDWDAQLAKAQRGSAITVVVVAERTDVAYYQREEIAAAIDLARDDAESHRVVPLFLSSAKEVRASVPYGLRLKHGIRLDEGTRLSDAAARLLNLLQWIQDRAASAFAFGNYVLQLTSPNLTEENRQQLINMIRELPGLPDSWSASVTGFVHLREVDEIIERIAPVQASPERKALHLGVCQRVLSNALKQKDYAGLLPRCVEQFEKALRSLNPPEELTAEVMTRVNMALSDEVCSDIEESIAPKIYSWLRMRGRGGLTSR